MKSALYRFLCAAVAAAVLMSLCGCGNRIKPEPISSEDLGGFSSLPSSPSSSDPEPSAPVPEGEPIKVGELYSGGSYLTMYRGFVPEDVRPKQYIRVFHSYDDVSAYYGSTQSDYLYGVRFTLTMDSFRDEFFEDHDVMILMITEPSSYANHTADPIEITDNEVRISITRHIPEDAPVSPTQYHLIFVAPKGSFDGAMDKQLKVDITEVIDQENNSAFDAESYRMYYPEYWNFCYRADALSDSPEMVIDIIDGYSQLVYFFEEYRKTFDLDAEFREYVGTLYNLEVFERYIILATIIPCAEETEPKTADLFVNNLEIYMTIDADRPAEGEEPKACYLLLTAVERSDMHGVKLSEMQLSFE